MDQEDLHSGITFQISLWGLFIVAGERISRHPMLNDSERLKHLYVIYFNMLLSWTFCTSDVALKYKHLTLSILTFSCNTWGQQFFFL